jgi:hypothetical protein
VIYLISAGWLACGIAAMGLCMAYFQRKWPQLAEEDYAKDLAYGLVLGLFGGPVSLIAVSITCRGYGWTLLPTKKS